MEEMNDVMLIENENDELALVDEVDEIEAAETGNGWKIGAAIGGLALAGFGIYKGVKWIAKKIKNKKAEAEQIDEDDVIDADVVEEVEETDE